MVHAKKTGTPQEIAATMRDVADTIDKLPPQLVITVEVNTTVHGADNKPQSDS